MLLNFMDIILRKLNIVRLNQELLPNIWNKKLISSLYIERGRKLIFIGLKLNLLLCTVVWYQLAHFYSPEVFVIGILNQRTYFYCLIINLNLLILGRVKIIFMIQMTKKNKHSLWQQSEEHLSIYLLFYGKHMLLMEALDLLNIIFISLMFSVLDLYLYSLL